MYASSGMLRTVVVVDEDVHDGLIVGKHQTDGAGAGARVSTVEVILETWGRARSMVCAIHASRVERLGLGRRSSSRRGSRRVHGSVRHCVGFCGCFFFFVCCL